MQPFVREAKKNTPYVNVDYDTGHVAIKGVSHPENVFIFYNPVIQAIKDFKKNLNRDVMVDFSLEYFNTSSARCLFLILKELKDLSLGGKKITINWHYEEADEDMLETGEDFEELIEMNFNYITIPEEEA